MSSSDDSLDNSSRFIPKLIHNYSQDRPEEEYSDFEELYDINDPIYSANEYKILTPTFSFTNYDEEQTSKIRSICHTWKMMTQNVEQCVDSSNQSCDSDCSYPERMKKLDESHTCTYFRPTVIGRRKVSFPRSDLKASDVLHTLDTYKSRDDYDEIPFIDDEAESLLCDNKNNSTGFSNVKDRIPKITVVDVDNESDDSNSEKKRSCDIGINVNLDSLTLKEVESSAIDSVTNVSEQNDFLGLSPSDQNFFSESSFDQKSNHYHNNIKMSFSTSGKNNAISSHVMKNKKTIHLNELNEYNILENDSNSTESKNICSEINSQLHMTGTENSHSITNKTKCRLYVSEANNNKYDNPSDVKLGFGKVKAIAKRFNDINLTYQSRANKRNSQSTPDISQCGVKIKDNNCTLQTTVTSSSLNSLKFDQEEVVCDSKPDKYSSEEQQKLLMLLEDWSKHGTKSNFDSSILDTPSKRVIYKSNVTVEATVNMMDKEAPKSLKSNIRSPLNKSFGSLEKLTGSLIPRNLELMSCKSSSTPNVNKKPKFAIEKTKLLLPRKKFPQSYIVKRKLPASNYNVVQSCPNLLIGNDFSQKSLKSNVNMSCPNFVTNRPVYMKVCRIEDRNTSSQTPAIPRYAWIQYGPTRMNNRRSRSHEDISKPTNLLIDVLTFSVWIIIRPFILFYVLL